MSATSVDMALEVVVIPVSDVGRAAAFYEQLGWRKDADLGSGDNRVLQFTPPGSPTSIIFGNHVTPSPPGTSQFLHLVVSDIEAARDDLVRHGADASEVFHDARGGYNRFDPAARAGGPDPAPVRRGPGDHVRSPGLGLNAHPHLVRLASAYRTWSTWRAGLRQVTMFGTRAWASTPTRTW